MDAFDESRALIRELFGEMLVYEKRKALKNAAEALKEERDRWLADNGDEENFERWAGPALDAFDRCIDRIEEMAKE